MLTLAIWVQPHIPEVSCGSQQARCRCGHSDIPRYDWLLGPRQLEDTRAATWTVGSGVFPVVPLRGVDRPYRSQMVDDLKTLSMKTSKKRGSRIVRQVSSSTRQTGSAGVQNKQMKEEKAGVSFDESPRVLLAPLTNGFYTPVYTPAERIRLPFVRQRAPPPDVPAPAMGTSCAFWQ